MFENHYQVVFKANSKPGDNTCTERSKDPVNPTFIPKLL